MTTMQVDNLGGNLLVNGKVLITNDESVIKTAEYQRVDLVVYVDAAGGYKIVKNRFGSIS